MGGEFSSWLEAQCCAIHADSSGLVVLGKTARGPFAPVAVWPPAEEGAAPSELVGAAQIAISTGRTAIRSVIDGTRDARQDIVAVPIVEAGTLRGAVAIRATHRDERSAQAIAALLERGIADLMRGESAAADAPAPAPKSPRPTARPEPARELLDLIVSVIDREAFGAATIALVTELATRLQCERVSLGFVEGAEVELAALSHSARFDARTALARDIAAAMEEAVDQEAVVAYPPLTPEALEVTAAHAALCSAHASAAACTVPLVDGSEIVGALGFEVSPGGTLHAEDVRFFEQAAAVLGPILELRRLDARPVWRVVLDAVRDHARSWLEPERGGRRWLAGAAAVLTLLLVAVPGTHRVSAPATLEGTVQRAIVASIDGYISESRARAGDVVKRGDVLGALDDTDLELERRKWVGRREQIDKEFRAAGASNDRSQLRILRARLDQADAEIALLDGKLARIQLKAPFDGVVTEGDLSQSLGSPVKRGDVLFEVAPLERYRIVLEVDEREIADVNRGQTGELTLSALPGRTLPLRVERITPLASTEEGRNFFRVEAELLEPPAALRPGMEGLAKIEIGPRSLIWIGTHRTIDWLRLAAWSWLP